MENNLIAYFDENRYWNESLDFFLNNKQEFAVSILMDEDREPNTITNEEVQEELEADLYFFEMHNDQFRYDIEDEFNQHINKEVYVTGTNIGWRNRTGQKTFVLEKPIDIFTEIAPQCQLSFYLHKINNEEYEVKLYHHDSPTGELYNIKIK